MARRTQGHSDIELSAEGKDQARSVAADLSQISLQAAYSSDLRRAFDTALRIAKIHGLEVTVDERLREIDEGEWEGLTEAQIVHRWPQLWEARHWSQRPGGESPEEVRRRSLLALRDIVVEYSAGAVVAVASQGNIRLVIAEALGYTDREATAIRGLQGGEGVRIDAHIEDDQLVLGQVTRLDGSPANLLDPAPRAQ